MAELARPPRRRSLSLTPLIDVIFLLLLFFMLTSTFARQSELEIALAGTGPGAAESRPLFLQLGPQGLSLNGESLDMAGLPAALASQAEDADALVLIALRDGVVAQRLVDVLTVLRAAGRQARVLR